MVIKIELLECSDLTPLEFCLCGWMKDRILQKENVYKRRIARSHFKCRCLHKKREDQFRVTRRDFRTRVGNCTEVASGNSEHIL
jgi:hypothetical protein